MKTLTKLASQRASAPILNTVIVQNGIATATDRKTYISASSDLQDGLYNGVGFDTDMRALSKDCMSDDFPVTDTDKGNALNGYEFDLKTLLDDMTYVSKAMSKEEIRYCLCGIAFHNDNMVATDGHRLHMVTYEGYGFTENIPNYESGVIIPSNAVKLLLALMKEYEKTESKVILTLYSNYTVFEIGDATLRTKYIDGAYPQYERVIPEHSESNKTVIVQKEMKEAFKQAKILAKMSGDSVKSIAINGTGVSTLMPSSEYAKDFPVSTTLKERTGFNLQYLADMTDSALYYSSSVEVVKAIAGNRLGVLMPLRVFSTKQKG